MKKKLSKVEKDAIINKAIEQAKRLTASYGPLPTKKITGPTVTVMEWKDVKTFHQPGLKIAYAIHLDSTKNIPANLKRLVKLNEQGLLKEYSLIDIPRKGRRMRRQVLNMRDVRRGRGGNPDLVRLFGGMACYMPGRHRGTSNFDVEKEFDDDGTPVIVVIRSDDESEVPEYKVRHVKRSEWKKKQKKQCTFGGGGGGGSDDGPPTQHFLKAPLKDEMLIEAMKAADQEMTGGDHAGHLRWTEDGEQHDKSFHNGYLMVCLFMYVYLMKLYAEGDFYNRRKAFYDYCYNGLENDENDKMNLKTYNYFQQNVQKLQARKESFEDFYMAKEKFIPEYVKGKANLLFWYELYRQTAHIFDRILTPVAAE